LAAILAIVPTPTPAELLAFALDLAEEADQITRPAFDAGPAATLKTDGTPVTAADTGTEQALRSRIFEAFPDHAVVGEEFGEQGGTSSVRWIIDPIDGTASFARNIPTWATLIAVEVDGELAAAVASAPAMGPGDGRRWWASKDGGAFTAERAQDPSTATRLTVSTIDTLAESTLLYASLSSMAKAGYGGVMHRAVNRVARDRGLGDFWAYMLIAQGSAEVMIETGVNLWDLATPALILAEAGGRLTSLAGEPSYAGPTSLATNGLLHEPMLELLTG
jgi:histidinol-phosphatase